MPEKREPTVEPLVSYTSGSSVEVRMRRRSRAPAIRDSDSLATRA